MITRGVGDVVAELKMARAAFPGALLVLEGPSDSLFWKNKVDKDGCQITMSGGKLISTRVTQILDNANFSGFISVVDDDYDHFLGRDYESDNLVFPETNDLETMLASSPALEKIMNEFLGHDPTHGASQNIAKLMESIKEISLFFGKLRYINREHQLNVSFEVLSPWKYVDQTSFVLNEASLIVEFSRLSGRNSEEILTWHHGCPSEPKWNVIQGHDFTCILAIAMRNKAKSCGEKNLCAALRLAYELAWFKATSMVSKISEWEMRHRPFLLT